jgi:hypothetical protein
MNQNTSKSPQFVRLLEKPITLSCCRCDALVEVVGFTESGEGTVLCLDCIQDSKLRNLLGVSIDARVDDILRVIKDEG